MINYFPVVRLPISVPIDLLTNSKQTLMKTYLNPSYIFRTPRSNLEI
ncbi:hypothetical protein GA0116948_109121 [Chitinophaga costaii]|uniref:Uncharacterized protein n=1 Tax=Chitinophaga costaii TaxID=1335309 RepID=A0A1C4EQU5_9BACT|nr:hypothetical protein GA0116948_109121 [Chitinophaga costaii]